MSNNTDIITPTNTTTTTIKEEEEETRDLINESINLLNIINQIEPFKKCTLTGAADLLFCASKCTFENSGTIIVNGGESGMIGSHDLYFVLNGIVTTTLNNNNNNSGSPSKSSSQLNSQDSQDSSSTPSSQSIDNSSNGSPILKKRKRVLSDPVNTNISTSDDSSNIDKQQQSTGEITPRAMSTTPLKKGKSTNGSINQQKPQSSTQKESSLRYTSGDYFISSCSTIALTDTPTVELIKFKGLSSLLK